MNVVDVAGSPVGGERLALIAGPCVIEDEEGTVAIAHRLAGICAELDLPFIFKASYDKANRTSIDSFRGPGIEEGLAVLGKVKERVGCPVLTDVHLPVQAEQAAAIVDALQVPAFLCRQTDLIVAAAGTGKPVNIKKGQFLAPRDMANVIAKAKSTGNSNIMVTERGTCFGYNTLVTDIRAIPIMQESGQPVVFDATHSVQQPGGRGAESGGDRAMVPVLACAATAAGADALFLEGHPDPDQAKGDAASMRRLGDVPALLRRVLRIRAATAEQD
jgi:2-dehydro-3-deoxyphosphooctonate aldolase (KDO 8-P synthase)